MRYIISALLSILSITRANNLKLLILHDNDIHGRYVESADSLSGAFVGGVARVATVVKEARRNAATGKGPPVLYLNAGDTFTGTIWHTVHRWPIASTILNALEMNATCVGNHEFDDGIDALAKFAGNLTFPILAANLDLSREKTLEAVIKPYTILTVDGVKIGVVGYLTPETIAMVNNVGEVRFEDEVIALNQLCKQLKFAGVNIIIALGHSGYEADKRIAREVECVDLVIGGHTNTFLWNGKAPDKELIEGPYPTPVKSRDAQKTVPVVQAFAHTKYIGHLEVTFDHRGDLLKAEGQPIFLNNKIPKDPSMVQLVEKFRAKIDKYQRMVVGQTRSFLDGECRIFECTFGNLITDAFVDYVAATYPTPYWTTAPIALLNSGAIRSSVNATRNGHNVTAGDILGAIPFNQLLTTFELSGKDLLATLELGARSKGETSRGEFLQVSGIKVVYDFSYPPGSRVKNVKVRCGDCHVPSYVPLNQDAYYRIVSTNYLLEGGDGHVVIKEGAKNITSELLHDSECIQRYFEFYKVVTPQLEERITVYNHPHDPDTGSAISIRPQRAGFILLIVSILVFYS